MQEQEGWQLLRSHFLITRQFAVVVLIAPDEWTLDQIHQHLPGLLPACETARDIPFQPHFPPATLTELILARHSSASSAQHLWVDVPAPAVALSDPALAPWNAAFSYLNRHRNHLPKVIPGTLIIAGTPETLLSLREAAPDLWSIRSALIQFTPAPVLPGYDLHDSQKRQRRSAYLRSLISAFSAYQELALDNYAGADQACPDIWDIFVHPACAQEHLRPEDMDAAQREAPPRLPAQDLLPILGSDTERRHVLLADPGMGKSTLIQSLIAHLASGRPLAGAPALNGLLPVPLILRDLVPLLPQDQPKAWTWDSLITALLEQYQRDETAPPLLETYRDHAAEFRQLIHSSDKVFFLIDGLDEIGDIEKRRHIARAIQEGIRTADIKARWLITSRVIGYDKAPVDVVRTSAGFSMPISASADEIIQEAKETQAVLVDILLEEWQEYFTGVESSELTIGLSPDGYTHFAGFYGTKPRKFVSQSSELRHHPLVVWGGLPIARRLYLAPFDDKRQDAFTSRWFRHRHSTDYSKELMREVRAHHHDGVRIISRVPNLLCMMNMLKRSGKPLPDGRAALYDEIVKAYLGGIDSAYKFKPIHGHTCPFEALERRHLLSLLGAHMQQQRARATQPTADDNQKTKNEEPRTDNDSILISMPELAQLLVPAIEAMQQAGKVKSDHSAAALLDELLHHIASRSGLLIPRSSDEHGNTVYGFTHLSFMEFFAAEWLGKEFDRLQKRLARRAEAMETDQTLTDADLDREFPAPQSIEHKRADFPNLAASPVWHEPLIFLVESRKSDTSTLLRWLFPELHSNKPYTVPEDEDKALPLMPLEAVRLAIQLAHDQELSLSPETRRHWWRTLWAAYLIWPYHLTGTGQDKRWPIAPLLLERAELRSEVLQVLVETYPKDLGLPDKLPPPVLYLNGCSNLTSTDLSQLTGLEVLEELWLDGCVGLESLPDFSTMKGLKILNLLGCTGLHGSHALNGLIGSRTLEALVIIGCTRLESLPDLSAMTSLKTVFLISCTGLNGSQALSGLAGLAHLEMLRLNGCTGLTEADVEEIRKMVGPQCQVSF